MPENLNQNQNETLILDIANNQVKNSEETKSKSSFVSLFSSINEWLIDSSTVPLQDKLLFFQLLAAMISAGMPIIDSLGLLINQTNNPKMQRVIKDMILSIEDGESMADAMRRNDDVFDEATCAVVEAGEKSGKLNEILKELVSQYEQISGLMKQIKAVMTYPIIVITVMSLLTVVVLLFVVPKLEDLFGGAANLPLPTRILIESSNFLINSWMFLLIILGGIIFGFKSWKNSKNGGKQWGVILLTMPVTGNILQKMILTRVCKIFSFLVGAGVPVVQSLKIASHISENELYKEKLLLAADDLTKGISIAENISDDEKLFPQMLVNMVAIGEKTASLDTVMGKAADFYKEELERKIGGLSKLMEPVVLMLISGGAVFMILAIYLPITKMNDQIMG